MFHLLQTQALDSIAGLVFSGIVLVLVVAFGTYVGVLVALQSFFGVDRWQELGSEREPASESRE